jgi:hypothetical protein
MDGESVESVKNSTANEDEREGGCRMANPLYRIRASNRGGSGYAVPPQAGEPFREIKNADGDLIKAKLDDDGEVIRLPGITTVLKVADGQGLIQWSVDQTAAYAVANVESLLNRTMEQGWGFLRFFHRRQPDLTDPLRSAHSGVLNDLAELGTNMHDWIEADLIGDFPPEVNSIQMQQMIEVWGTFKFMHDIKPVYTEVTLYGEGYAGTFDLLAWIDGELWLIDIKTSRRVGKSHKMQLAALRDAPLMLAKNADEVWEKVDFPQPTRYGFIQIRPDDDDREAFVELHEVSETELDFYLRRFRACLEINTVDHELKQWEKDGMLDTAKEEES